MRFCIECREDVPGSAKRIVLLFPDGFLQMRQKLLCIQKANQAMLLAFLAICPEEQDGWRRKQFEVIQQGEVCLVVVCHICL